MLWADRQSTAGVLTGDRITTRKNSCRRLVRPTARCGGLGTVELPAGALLVLAQVVTAPAIGN